MIVISVEFRSGLDVLKGRRKMSKLTTGNADLNSLLGGGIEPGHFYLFYGDNKIVDLLIHQILVNCLLPEEKYGFNGKAVYSNCGNYREEKTILDSRLLSFLIKAAKLDPMKALDNIYVICAFSGEQQEQIVSEVQKLLEEDENKIKLVVVHNIAKLFTSPTGTANKNFGERISRLQKVVLKLWQACARNNIAFVASCRSNKTSRDRIPQPEGGKYLRHEANVIVYLRKRDKKSPFVKAYLLKHPNRASRKIDFEFTEGGNVAGRMNLPFRTILREEMNRLKRSYREALLDASRRDAFDNLLKVWSSEQGAMSYAKVPTVLDVMLLTAVIDNRKLIEDLFDQVGIISSKIDMVQKRLERVVD